MANRKLASAGWRRNQAGDVNEISVSWRGIGGWQCINGMAIEA